jgi:hypothetical protein
MYLSIKNLTDCWWQIPPFGKDFHADFCRKIDELPEVGGFTDSGTDLEWEKTSLGP